MARQSRGLTMAQELKNDLNGDGIVTPAELRESELMEKFDEEITPHLVELDERFNTSNMFKSFIETVQKFGERNPTVFVGRLIARLGDVVSEIEKINGRETREENKDFL